VIPVCGRRYGAIRRFIPISAAATRFSSTARQAETVGIPDGWSTSNTGTTTQKRRTMSALGWVVRSSSVVKNVATLPMRHVRRTRTSIVRSQRGYPVGGIWVRSRRPDGGHQHMGTYFLVASPSLQEGRHRNRAVPRFRSGYIPGVRLPNPDHFSMFRSPMVPRRPAPTTSRWGTYGAVQPGEGGRFRDGDRRHIRTKRKPSV